MIKLTPEQTKLILLSLRRSVAYCRVMIECEQSARLEDAGPTEDEFAWRNEARFYRRLLKELRTQGKQGLAGEKPQVSPPQAATNKTEAFR
jgi:hypothetical protein